MRAQLAMRASFFTIMAVLLWILDGIEHTSIISIIESSVEIRLYAALFGAAATVQVVALTLDSRKANIVAVSVACAVCTMLEVVILLDAVILGHFPLTLVLWSYITGVTYVRTRDAWFTSREEHTLMAHARALQHGEHTPPLGDDP